MRLRLIAAGKLREAHLRTAVDDYLGRLGHYLPVDEVEVPQGRGPRAVQAFRRAVPAQHELWALEVHGKAPSSPELADWIHQRMLTGAKGIAFAIGGAEGLPRQLVDRADLLFSLSRLTLPHRLARLILAEQLYRALTIIRGEKYHK